MPKYFLILIAAALVVEPGSLLAQQVFGGRNPPRPNPTPKPDPNPVPIPPKPKPGGVMDKHGDRGVLERYRESLEDFRESAESLRVRNGADPTYERNIRDYRNGIDTYRERVQKADPK